MNSPLSIGARKQAQELRRQLRRGEPVVMCSGLQMNRRKSLAELQAWCEEQGVGEPRRADGGWRFDRDTLARLEQALEDQGLASLDTEPAATRIGRLQQGAQEHKTLGEAPLEHRVLCSLVVTVTPEPLDCAPARHVLDMDWRRLDPAAFDVLLVVENADVFYACGSPDWPLQPELSDYLVVYRGHDYRSKGVKALQHAWDCRTPRVYFGDIDPKGMSIALQEGYSHVLLPSIDCFKHGASAFHAPAGQEASQRYLGRCLHHLREDHPLRPWLQLLVDGRGLRQQSALTLPLTLMSAPRVSVDPA